MKQEGEVRYCDVARNVFIKHFNHNYSYIKEKLPLLDIFDPDAIHDIRVTTRRNRALFTEFKSFLPEEIRKKYVSENKNITRLLGKRRELDVLFQIFTLIKRENSKIFPEHISEILSIFFIEERKKEEKNCMLAKQILETQIKQFDSNFQWYFSKRTCIYENGKKRIIFLLDNIQKEYKEIRKIENPLNKKIHEFRILLKKSRYVFEIYKEIYEGALDDLLDILKEIQTYLGVWNDYRIFLITIKKIYKEGRDMNSYEFYRIKEYLYAILLNELIKSKKVMGKRITKSFIRLTKKYYQDV